MTEQEYKTELERFIEPLDEPWKKSIRNGDRKAMEWFEEAKREHAKARDELGEEAFDQAWSQHRQVFLEKAHGSVCHLF